MQRVIGEVMHRLSISSSDETAQPGHQPGDHPSGLHKHHLFRRRSHRKDPASGSPPSSTQQPASGGFADGYAAGVAAAQTRRQQNSVSFPEEPADNDTPAAPATPSPGPPEQPARTGSSSLRSVSADRYSLRSGSGDWQPLRSASCAERSSLDGPSDVRRSLHDTWHSTQHADQGQPASRQFHSLSPDREQFFTVSRPDGHRRPSMGTRPSPPGSRPSWHSPRRQSSPGDWPAQWQTPGPRGSSPGDRPPVLGSGQPRLSSHFAHQNDLSPERLSRECTLFESPLPDSHRNSMHRGSQASMDSHRNSQPSYEQDRRHSLAHRRLSSAEAHDSPDLVMIRPHGQASSSSPARQAQTASTSPSATRHVSISPEVKRVNISPDGRGVVSTERVSIGDRISRDHRRSSAAASSAGSTDSRKASIAGKAHTSRRSVTLSRALQTSGGSTEQELPDFLQNPNSVLHDAGPWRDGKMPNYDSANRKFEAERSVFHAPGTVGDQVTNLVKSWEREASHKINAADWRTVDASCYRFSCNGGQKYNAEEMAEMGTYNALIGEHAFYSASSTSFEQSHAVFKDAMPRGFAWEVVELYSGPPVVAFKWRHWGEMTGPLRCPMGHGSTITAPATNANIEIWGVAVAHVNAECRITNLEIFYDPHELMAQLTNSRNFASAEPVHIPQPVTGAACHPDEMNFSPTSDFQSHKSSCSLDVPSMRRSEDSLESHFSDDFYIEE